jgi:hypothetical protein
VLILLAHLNDAYLIDVREHEHWSDQDLVEIVHTNWPAALAQHRQVKVLGLTHAVSNDGRAALQGKGCNARARSPGRMPPTWRSASIEERRLGGSYDPRGRMWRSARGARRSPPITNSPPLSPP